MSLSASKENIILARSCCRRFEFNDRLETLDAARFNVGIEEAKMIGAVLRNHTTYWKLKVLLLRYNKLGDEGIIHLAACLRVNKSLKVLSVAQNQFTDQGLVALSRSIRCHESLRKVDVAQNKVTCEGLTSLGEAIVMNNTLDWVCVNVYLLPVKRLKGSIKTYVSAKQKDKISIGHILRSRFRVGAETIQGSSGLDAVIVEVLDTPAMIEANEIEGGDGMRDTVQLVSDFKEKNVLGFETEDASNVSKRKAINGVSKLEVSSSSSTTTPSSFPAPALCLPSDDAKNSGTIECTRQSMNLADLSLNYADGIIASHLLVENRYIDSFRISSTPLPLGQLDNLRVNVVQLQNLSMRASNIYCADACVLAKILEMNNATLSFLDLSENEIGSNGAWALGTAILSNRGLTFLDLSKNKLTDTGVDERGIISIAHALDANSTLRTLKLANNHIGSAGAIGFGEVLHGDDGLLELDLTDNIFGDDEGGDALVRGLRNNETLIKLNGISLSQEGEKPRAWGLKRFKDTTVPEYTANLSHHQSDGFQFFEAAFVAHRLKLSQTVTILNLSKNMLGAPHLRLIAEALPGQPTLKTLDVTHNRLAGIFIDRHGIEHGTFDGQGVEALAKALSETRNARKKVILSTLDMRASHIRDPRKKLADAMQRNTSLTVLNGMTIAAETLELVVDDRVCGLQPYESSFIGARIMNEARELDVLSVRRNKIVGLHCDGTGFYDPYGGIAIARGLATNDNLATLDFSENMLGPLVSAALFKVLETNSKVEMLRMSKNDIQGTKHMRSMCVDKTDDSAVLALKGMICRNKRITTLDLSDNCVSCYKFPYMMPFSRLILSMVCIYT